MNLFKIFRVFEFMFKSIRLIKNWPVLRQYVIAPPPSGPGKYVIKLRSGLRFQSSGDIADVVVLVETFGGESNYDYFLKNQSFVNGNIIDIGAHFGSSSVNFSKKYPASKTYSYEPDPQNFENLQANLKLNEIHNVKCYNNAVGKQTGKITLYSQEDGNFGTATSSTVRKGSNSVLIDCVTLDDIIKTNDIDTCDLLKIDTEGAEYDILYGADKELFAKIKNISIEYHNYENNNGSELESYLKKLGYKTVKHTTKRNPIIGYIYATHTL